MHGLRTSQVSLLLSLLVYSFLAFGSVAAQTQYSYNSFGDVIVYINESSWRCDRIFCPAGTDRCEVKKYKSQENAKELIRENKCLAANNSPLVSERYIEKIKPNEFDDLYLVVTSTGSSVVQQRGNGVSRQLTPEEAEQLNRTISQNIQRGQEMLRRNLEKARETMRNAFARFGNFGNFGNWGNYGNLGSSGRLW